MGLLETAIVYGALGLAVAGALALREERRGSARLAGQLLMAVVFWPLFAPTVLSHRGASTPPPRAARSTLSPRIRAAEERLLAALARVQGGVAAEALAPEVARIQGLGGSLEAMARRIGDIDALLASPEFDEPAARATLHDLAARAHGDDDPRVVSVRARLRNIERLRAMRARSSDDLERAVLEMEELASQVLLLELAGEPDAEVVRRIKDVADTVQRISEALLAL